MKIKQEEEERLMAALRRLANAKEPIVVRFPEKFQLWALLSQVQLALRHPINKGSSKLVRALIEQLAEPLWANEPDLRLLWQMGFEVDDDDDDLGKGEGKESGI